ALLPHALAAAQTARRRAARIIARTRCCRGWSSAARTPVWGGGARRSSPRHRRGAPRRPARTPPPGRGGGWPGGGGGGGRGGGGGGGGGGGRGGGRGLEAEAAGILLVLLGLEVVDQLLDLRAVGRVGRGGQVLLVAEDRRVVLAEVAVALADVEQEVRDRLGVERLLGLVQRLAERGQRV